MIIERKEIRVNIGDIDLYDFEGSLENAIKLLQSFKEGEAKYDKYSIVADSSFEGEDGYAMLVMYGHRVESDEEYKIRQDIHNKEELRRYMRDKDREEEEQPLPEVETTKKAFPKIKYEQLKKPAKKPIWKYA